MINAYKILGMPGVILVFLALVVAIILLFNLIVKSASKQALAGQEGQIDFLVKKYPSVDLAQYKGLIRNIGLILSLAIVLVFFEFPNFEEQTLVQLTGQRDDIEEMHDIPPTEHIPPPPPKMQQPEILEVPDEEEIEQEIEVDFDIEVTEDAVIEEVQFFIREEKVEEVVDQIFEIVEEPAAPANGYQEFYAFVAKNMKYPRKAIDMGVAGRVYVRFIVDRDGTLTNIEVVRGIGYGCDEEAIRVLQGAPKWKPGKQRGRPVRQRMVIPIAFKLADM